MNCLFRDQHIVGFGSPQIWLTADLYGRVAKSRGNGVTPVSMRVDAAAYQTTATIQFHKGRSIVVR